MIKHNSKIYEVPFLQQLENTTIVTIIKSRFIKPKIDKEIERKRAICLGCEYNSNNLRRLSIFKSFLSSLSDFYSWITGNKKVDVLGVCNICSCSLYFKTMFNSEKCEYPGGSRWQNKQTILKFSLPNCKPCVYLLKQMESLDLSNHNLQEINVNEQRDIADKYNIKSVPVIVILDVAGNETTRFRNIVKLKEFLEENGSK